MRSLLASFASLAAAAVAPAGLAGGQAWQTTALPARASYPPDAVARLLVTAPAGPLVVDPVSAVPPPGKHLLAIGAYPALDVPRTIPWRGGSGAIYVHIGDWPSGVYFFRVRSSGGTAYAPLVLRPRRLGSSDVAVVVPTYTWQAYNFRDGDTWYACACVRTVDLSRPYLRAGIPPHFRNYERGFLEWLAMHGKSADFLSDEDLERIDGDQLRRLYRLVVFSGHEEYVTEHEYDETARYRELGGHLMMLSANNFFRDVVVRGSSMTLVGRWRDLGRPEAALLGAQYLDWNHGWYRNRPYRVVGATRLPWLFRGTRLHNGSTIDGSFGIEIDARTPASPAGTVVAAEIPDAFGSETAEMTWGRGPRGAEVFDAGTMNFGGSALLPDVSALLSNLWAKMA